MLGDLRYLMRALMVVNVPYWIWQHGLAFIHHSDGFFVLVKTKANRMLRMQSEEI